MTRTKIAEIISSLGVGDSVRVVWSKNGNKSVEAGKVWNPGNSQFFGLGPDLLDPADTELISIEIVTKAPVTSSQPALGSVAVFVDSGAKNIYAFKRMKKGWYGAGTGGPTTWSQIIKKYKSPTQIFTVGTPPAKPTSVTATAGVRKMTVASTLGSTGSSSIRDVEYQLTFEFQSGYGQESTKWISTGQTTGNFEILNLEPGVAFSVRVRAVNDSGPGEISDKATATPYSTPGAPVAVSATPGVTSAVIVWDPPESDGGSAITGYKIEKILASNNDGWVTVIENTESTATTYTATGLASGVLTGFRVYAINAAGIGLPSQGSTGVTPSAS